MECGGGELSDSGSSGYWSCDHGYGSPAPSPPITETEGHSLAMPPDEGLDMEQVLFDEPAPRKRRVSRVVTGTALLKLTNVTEFTGKHISYLFLI